MKPDEIGGPVRTRFGYHVVKVISHKKVPPPEFAELKGKLQIELTNKRLGEALKKWVEELKGKAFIEVRL